MRRLRTGLIAEGESDVAFLRPLLQAQLERIAWDRQFEVVAIRVADTTTVKAANGSPAQRSNCWTPATCSSCIMTSGRRRRSTGCGSRPERPAAWSPWCRCGRPRPGCWRPPAPRSAISYCWTPRLPNGAASGSRPSPTRRRSYAEDRGGQSPEDLSTLVAEQADLVTLAGLPAYQNFLQDLTTALKELNFR